MLTAIAGTAGIMHIAPARYPALILLQPLPPGPTSPSTTYAEYLSITLTALALMITLFTFVAAILGLWGYVQIKRAMIEAASTAGIKAAKEHLAEYLVGPKFKDILKTVLATPAETAPDDVGSLGKEYPGSGPEGEQ